MSIHSRISGIWREIKEVHVNVSGTWRRILSTQVRHLGAWRDVGGVSTPGTPTLSTQTNNTDGTYSISASSFDTGGFAVSHTSTDWQLTSTSDTSFTSPIYQSLTDTTNLTSIRLDNKSLPSNRALLARVRYRANDTGVSAWSSSFVVYTAPSLTFTGTSATSQTYAISSYSGNSASHTSSDYALTKTSDTSFASALFNVTGQSATSYTRNNTLKGSSTYRVRVRANFNDGRNSPYTITNVTTGSYQFTATYTSNTTITTPYGPDSSGTVVYVEVGGGRGGGSCQSAGRGRIFGMNLPLSDNTNYYAYPSGVSGGRGASCGGRGGNAAVFATTSNQAYLIGGGGGGVRQCCHCCNCACDGCGGGAGATSGGNGACGTCCGCGAAGGTWGGSRLGGGSTSSGERGNNPSCCSDCNGGNSHAYGTLSTNSLNSGGPYVYIRW